jgi:hypothetical protein
MLHTKLSPASYWCLAFQIREGVYSAARQLVQLGKSTSNWQVKDLCAACNFYCSGACVCILDTEQALFW